MVYANAYSGMVFLADIDERHQFVLDLLQFCSIFLIRVFQMLERTSRVDIVARIDAHLLTVEGSHISGMSREMHVSHEGLLIAIRLQTGGDILHVLSLTRTLGREAHQFATSVDNPLGLTDAALSIIGIHRGHRLDADGVLSANADIPYTGLST